MEKRNTEKGGKLLSKEIDFELFSEDSELKGSELAKASSISPPSIIDQPNVAMMYCLAATLL